jgi:anthranilate synthase component II
VCRVTGHRVLVVDNYDSFAYNLVQALGELGADVDVVRNDALTVDEVEQRAPRAIVLSPGPRRPAQAGISVELVRRLAGRVHLLGVCLGHQCIAEAFGGRLIKDRLIVHGKTSWIHHGRSGIYADLPDPFEGARYHSLVVDPQRVPGCLVVTSRTADGIVMGLRHRTLSVEGTQFHPESFLTREGPTLLHNFLARCDGPADRC